MNQLRIGEVARACGISADTIRHYERIGVIPHPTRDGSGYRRYAENTIRRVMMVRRALQIGFTLQELARIFRKRAAGQAPCHDVRALAVRKLADLDDRIRQLQALRSVMAATVDGWSKRLDATVPGELAHLLETLTDVEWRTN